MANLREELQGIYAQRGKLTAEIVVAEARSKESALHSHFEWDDSVAAEKYRLDQAGALIRTFRVKYADTPNGPKTVRQWVHISGREDDPGASYMPTEEAVMDPTIRRIILRDMERDWKSFKARFEHMVEFYELIRSELSDDKNSDAA